MKRLVVLTEAQHSRIGAGIHNWTDDSDEMEARLGRNAARALFLGHSLFSKAPRIPDDARVLVLTPGEARRLEGLLHTELQTVEDSIPGREGTEHAKAYRRILTKLDAAQS